MLGYGSLGGEELGFGSDLDLVFLYDAAADAQSDGARPLDAPRWFARLAQKIVALLGTVTGAGRLYEVDVRLRPDGAKGLLVSSLAELRRLPARARLDLGAAGAGARTLRCRRCGPVRRLRRRAHATLCAADAMPHALRATSCDARADARANSIARDAPRASTSSRAKAAWSTWNSCCSSWCCAMRTPAGAAARRAITPGLLAALCGRQPARWHDVRALPVAHAALLDAGLRCTLDRRPRITPETDAIAAARGVIRAVRATGLSPATG